MRYSRRRVIELLGAGSVTLAGCTSSSESDEDDEEPPKETEGEATQTPRTTRAGEESATETGTASGPSHTVNRELSLSGPASEQPWPMPRADPQNTAQSRDSGPTEEPTEVAAFERFGTLYAPIIAHDALFVAGSGGLHAVSLDDQSVFWVFQLGTGGFHHIAVTGSRVVAWDTEGRVWGLDAATGREQWRVTDFEADIQGLTVAAGTAYVSTLDGLTAIDTETGAVSWRTDTSVDLHTVPAVSDSTVVVTGAQYGSEMVAAYDTESGSERWAVENDQSPVHEPVVLDGTVYHTTQQGEWGYDIRAHDLGTGERQWRRSFDGAADYPPAVTGSALVWSQGSTVEAVDPATGTTEWAHSFEDTANPGLLTTDASGTVYVSTSRPTSLHALDGTTGETVWSMETNFDVDGVTAVDGDIYFSELKAARYS